MYIHFLVTGWNINLILIRKDDTSYYADSYFATNVIFLLLNESYVIHKNIIFPEIKFHLYNQTHMLTD